MFHCAPVMHHLQSSVLTLGGDPYETAAEHPDAVAQKRAVSRIVNITFHDRRVGAKFASLRYTLLTRQAHHTLMSYRVIQGVEAWVLQQPIAKLLAMLQSNDRHLHSGHNFLNGLCVAG